MTRSRITAPLAAALLVTAACNSTPVYPQDEACSLDAETVSEVLGSDRFTATAPELAGVPLTPDSTPSLPARTSCAAYHDDNRVVVEATIVDQRTVEDEVAKAQGADTSFEYRGGFGDTTIRGVSWICGNVLARVYVVEELETQPDWQELAEPVWDQVGCLTLSATGESFIPEGWP